MATLNVRLTPWASKRIKKNYGGISADTLRQSLADFPDTEFWTMRNATVRDGAVLTTREAIESGINRLSVYTVDNDGNRHRLTVIGIHPSGQVVVL